MNRHLNIILLGFWFIIQASAYSIQDCPGTKTASGTKPTVGRTCAASPDIKMGTRIYVPSRGWYTVEDRMHSRYKTRTLDLYMSNSAECRRWGRRSVWVWVGEPEARMEGRNPH